MHKELTITFKVSYDRKDRPWLYQQENHKRAIDEAIKDFKSRMENLPRWGVAKRRKFDVFIIAGEETT
jgi:hypothetical protein